jgi:hypothetical protein
LDAAFDYMGKAGRAKSNRQQFLTELAELARSMMTVERFQ